MQVAVFAEIDRRALYDERWENIFAIPNGGARVRPQAASSKPRVCAPGFPIFSVPFRVGSMRGFLSN